MVFDGYHVFYSFKLAGFWYCLFDATWSTELELSVLQHLDRVRVLFNGGFGFISSYSIGISGTDVEASFDKKIMKGRKQVFGNSLLMEGNAFQ